MGRFESAVERLADTPIASNVLQFGSDTANGIARIIRRPTRSRALFDHTLQRPLISLTQGLKNLFRPNLHLGLAEESLKTDEEQITQEIIEIFRRNLDRRYATRRYERGANAKTYGVVRAEFQVLQDQDLPRHLAKGVFAEPATYPAWIRVADTGSVLTPDPEHVGVVGMGIKLMGMPGPKLLEDEKNTQDFTLIGVRTFTAPDTAGMARLQTAILKYRPAAYFFSPRHPGRLLDFTMQALDSRLLGSPLESQLFSCTAHLHGAGQAVHYSVRPLADRRTPIPRFPSDNYLREAMIETLRREDVYFEFMAQLQRDPHRQPIEDPSIEWKESDTPFIPVARIRMPRQEFSSIGQLHFADRLSFNPWHSLPEHRPLGNINRSRKALYIEVSRIRQQHNGVDHYEPTGDENFD